jgi:hypothetical protein
LRVKIAAKVRKTSARGEANSVALLVAGTELDELAAAEVLDPPAAALVLLPELPVLVPLLEPVAEAVELLAPVAVELVLLAVVVAINVVEVETCEEEALEPVDEAVEADAVTVAPRSWN